jgi:hypothetical protein
MEPATKSAAAVEPSTTTAAVATSRETRLGQADQDNRGNQNTKNSQQVGFIHLKSSTARPFNFDDTPA